MREGPRYQQLAAGIRERFDALVPQLIQAAAEMPNPDATLIRSLDLLESITRRAAYTHALFQGPWGEIPVGGRSGQHFWNEALMAAQYELATTAAVA